MKRDAVERTHVTNMAATYHIESAILWPIQVINNYYIRIHGYEYVDALQVFFVGEMIFVILRLRCTPAGQ